LRNHGAANGAGDRGGDHDEAAAGGGEGEALVRAGAEDVRLASRVAA
jgi:hypothetical protein